MKSARFFALTVIVILFITILTSCTKQQVIIVAKQDSVQVTVIAVANNSQVTYNIYAEEVSKKAKIYVGLHPSEAQERLNKLAAQGYPYVPFLPVFKGQKFYKTYRTFVMSEPLYKFRRFTIMLRKALLEKEVDTYLLVYKLHRGNYEVVFGGESGELAARTFCQRVTARLDSSAMFKSHLMLIDASGFENSTHKEEIQSVLDNYDFKSGFLRLRFFEEDFAKGQRTPIYLVSYAVHPDSMMEFAKKFYTYGEFLGCLKGL